MRFGRLSLYLSSITLLQILLSFGMQLYVVSVFGVGIQSDALYAGQTLNTIFKVLLPDTLAMVLIPLLAAKTEEDLRRSAWCLIVASVVFFIALSFLLSAASPLFTLVLVPGFSASAKHLTVSLMRVQIFGLVGSGCVAVLTALYQVRNRFVFPALSVLAGAAVGWGWLLFALKRSGDIRLAAWAQVLAFTMPAVFMAGILTRSARMEWQPVLLRETWKSMRPLLLGKAYGLAMSPIDRIIGSYLPAGSIVILSLVGRFYGAAQRTFVQGVLTPFTPYLSRSAHDADWRAFKAMSSKQFRFMVSIGVVALVGVAVSSLLWTHYVPAQPPRLIAGRISSVDLAKIWAILFWTSGALLGGCAGNALTNSFIAKGDTRTPTKVAMAALTVGVVLKIGAAYVGGIVGMAISDTCVALAACAVLWFILHKRIERYLSDAERPQFIAETSSASARA